MGGLSEIVKGSGVFPKPPRAFSKKAAPKKPSLVFFLIFGFFLLFSPFPLSAQSGSLITAGKTGDSFNLKLAVIGPGDELYFWWGHIGIIVEDKTSGEARFFDWGVFSFDNENFFVNFALGRLLYSCAVSRAENNFAVYKETNRDVTLYTLDLPAAKKEEIIRFAENNVLPENRDYFYHHFKDNCATRIRDILDMAVDGQFRAAFADAPGRYTLRQQVRRHTWYNPFIDWMLNFLMGQDIDRPMTVWEDMFLPSEIAMRAADFRYTAPDGTVRNLVSGVEIFNKSEGRPAVLEVPRIQWPRQLIASVLFSGLLVVLFVLRGGRKGFNVFIGLVQSALGLFFGAAGTVLAFMSFFTDHDYTYHNSNIIFVNPLLFIAVPLGIIFAFTKNEKKRFKTAGFLRTLWTYVFLGALLTIAVKLSPSFYQQNQVTQALVMPFALTLVLLMAKMGSVMIRGGKHEAARKKS